MSAPKTPRPPFRSPAQPNSSAPLAPNFGTCHPGPLFTQKRGPDFRLLCSLFAFFPYSLCRGFQLSLTLAHGFTSKKELHERFSSRETSIFLHYIFQNWRIAG